MLKASHMTARQHSVSEWASEGQYEQKASSLSCPSLLTSLVLQGMPSTALCSTKPVKFNGRCGAERGGRHAPKPQEYSSRNE